MPFINYEVNLILTWSSICFITNSTGAGRSTRTDTKLYVPVVPFSTQNNAKLFEQLKPGFKYLFLINWNKYQTDLKTYTQNQYLNHLVDPNFQVVNRLFLLSFENKNGRTSHSEYYFPKVEIKDYNVKIDGRKFFDQPTMTLKNTKILEKMTLVKEMITQLVVC